MTDLIGLGAVALCAFIAVKLSRGAQLMGVRPPKRIGMWIAIIGVAFFALGAKSAGHSPMERAHEVFARLTGCAL